MQEFIVYELIGLNKDLIDVESIKWTWKEGPNQEDKSLTGKLSLEIPIKADTIPVKGSVKFKENQANSEEFKHGFIFEEKLEENTP
jgi:hypothetical protein